MLGIGRLGLCRFGLFDRRLRLVLALVENPKSGRYFKLAQEFGSLTIVSDE